MLFLSVVVAKEVSPEGNLLGLEFIGLAFLGFIGGVLAPLTAHIARLILVEGSLERRVVAALVAALGGAFNGFWLAFCFMIPVLALLHSLNPNVPYLLPGEYERYVAWRDAGAWAGAGFGAGIAAWMVQSFAPQAEPRIEDQS